MQASRSTRTKTSSRNQASQSYARTLTAASLRSNRNQASRHSRGSGHVSGYSTVGRGSSMQQRRSLSHRSSARAKSRTEDASNMNVGDEADAAEDENDDDDDEEDENAEGSNQGMPRSRKCALGVMCILSTFVLVTAAFALIYLKEEPSEQSAEAGNSTESGEDGFSPWEEWGDCSVTCGGGKQKRVRQCSLQDDSCEGEREEAQDCAEEECGDEEEEEKEDAGSGSSKTASKAEPLKGLQDTDDDVIRWTAYKSSGGNDTCYVEVTEVLPNVAYSLKGYVLDRGMPFHTETLVDPGYTLERIFAADSKTGKTATTNCGFVIPAGFDYSDLVSCSGEFSCTETKSKEDLKKLLKIHVKLDVKNPGNWAFSSNVDFRRQSRVVENELTDTAYSTATCYLYKLVMKSYGAPPLLKRFYDAVVELSNLKDDAKKKDEYFNFIQTYGSHFPIEVDYGARFTVRYEFKKRLYDATHNDTTSVKTIARLGAKGFLGGIAQASVSFGLNLGNSERGKDLSQYTEYTIMSLGAEPPSSYKDDGAGADWAEAVFSDPAGAQPIYVRLRDIEDLFTPKYFRGTDMSAKALAKVRKEMTAFKKDYCRELRRRGKDATCEAVDDKPTVSIQPACSRKFFVNGNFVAVGAGGGFQYRPIKAFAGLKIVQAASIKGLVIVLVRKDGDDRATDMVQADMYFAGRQGFTTYVSPYAGCRGKFYQGLTIDRQNEILFVAISDKIINMCHTRNASYLGKINLPAGCSAVDFMVANHMTKALYFACLRNVHRVPYRIIGNRNAVYSSQQIAVLTELKHSLVTGMDIDYTRNQLLAQGMKGDVVAMDISGNSSIIGKQQLLWPGESFQEHQYYGLMYCKDFLYYTERSSSAILQTEVRYKFALPRADGGNPFYAGYLGDSPTAACPLPYDLKMERDAHIAKPPPLPSVNDAPGK